MFLDMRHPGGGQSGKEIAGRGHTGGRGTSQYNSPSPATAASSSSVVAPSASSAHPPQQHYPSEEEDLHQSEEEVEPPCPGDRTFVSIDRVRYNLNSSTQLKGINVILIAMV